MSVLYIDERMIKLPLMENPAYINSIVVGYLLFVKILGPAWMRNRKPYDLRTIMVLYNFAMVIFSAWMCYKCGKHGWFRNYSWICQEIDNSTDEDAMAIVKVSWYFYISKIIELLDTCFFVLRKKYSQISFLHLVHHSLVPITVRFAGIRGAGGYNVLFGFLNTFVHVWMYLYYGLAALGIPGKYLWWKKHLTMLQMIQFCIVFVSMLIHVFHPNCKVNSVLILINVGNAVFFFVLFAHFYMTSYKKKKKFSIKPEEDSVKKTKTTELENGNIILLRNGYHSEITNRDSISH